MILFIDFTIEHIEILHECDSHSEMIEQLNKMGEKWLNQGYQFESIPIPDAKDWKKQSHSKPFSQMTLFDYYAQKTSFIEFGSGAKIISPFPHEPPKFCCVLVFGDENDDFYQDSDMKQIVLKKIYDPLLHQFLKQPMVPKKKTLSSAIPFSLQDIVSTEEPLEK